MAALEPGTRHLFKTGDRNSSQRTWECLTCYYENGTLISSRSNENKSGSVQDAIYASYKNYLVNVSLEDGEAAASPHCLFSKVYFSSVHNPKYYVLDCLGPEVPTSVLVQASTNSIISILNLNSELRSLFTTMAVPQIKTFQVEIENGYHAQVRLYLPPGFRDYEEMTFPLVLHV